MYRNTSYLTQNKKNGTFVLLSWSLKNMSQNLARKHEFTPNFNILKTAYKRFPPETMPFINKSIARLKKERPYFGLNIVHNLHITFSTVCKIIPLLYSGANVTMTATKELQIDKDALNLITRANVPFIFPENLPNNFDIALDCGGGLSEFVCPKIGAAEITQSGKAKYQNANINYPVISVDESNLKQLETLFGTGDGFVRALGEITKEDIRHKKIVLFGYGKVGHGIVNSLQEFTKDIVIIELNSEQIQEAIKDGYRGISLLDTEQIKSELNTAFCAVTATGEKETISKHFNQNDFGCCRYLANMGTEDEFGSNFSNDKILCDKAPINFSIKVPTLSKYLDPIFYAHNSVIDLLLSGKFLKGFHHFPFDFDMQILERWKNIYTKDGEKLRLLRILNYSNNFDFCTQVA